MNYNQCTKEESDLLEALNRYGFMSFNQASYILSNFSTCHNDKQAQAVVYSLARRRCVEWADGHKFILTFSKAGDQFVNFDIIKALGVVIKKAGGLKDVLSAIVFDDAYKTLCFTSGGRLYNVSCMRDTAYLPSLFMNEQMFKEQMDAFNIKEELDESDFAYTTIFVFSANADREEVLNTFNKTTLRLPHEIWFLQNDDLSEDLEYKIFMP